MFVAEMLEVLLEADPRLKFICRNDNIFLEFSRTTIVVPYPNCNPKRRVTLAMAAIAHRMVFCYHCQLMNAKCGSQTMGIYGGLRIVLAKDQLKRLEEIIRAAYPETKMRLRGM